MATGTHLLYPGLGDEWEGPTLKTNCPIFITRPARIVLGMNADETDF